MACRQEYRERGGFWVLTTVFVYAKLWLKLGGRGLPLGFWGLVERLPSALLRLLGHGQTCLELSFDISPQLQRENGAEDV